MSARVGAIVGISYDAPECEVDDVLRTPTGRCYLVHSLRRQRYGLHRGRWHIRCIVIRQEDVPEDATVRELRWYPREKQ